MTQMTEQGEIGRRQRHDAMSRHDKDQRGLR
jgi:hypothetical protein